MELRLLLACSDYDPLTQSWTVELQGPDTKTVCSGSVINPFTPAEEDGLSWYLHKFAIDEPFAGTRAAIVAESLAKYRKTLARCLEPLILHALKSCECVALPEAVILSIHEPSIDRPSLQLIHWELLEDPQAWKEIAIPVLFVRWVSRPAVLTPDRIISPSSKAANITNILVISARPGGRNDHPYRLISQPLWDLVHSDTELASRIKIHFVRPGTWSAFQNVLLNMELGFGFFSVVHFDTHGILDKQGRAGLLFSASSSNKTRPVFVEASRIGALLSESGVDTVVLNACETAKVTNLATSNLAQVLTSSGVSNVVAMAFRLMASSAKMFMGTFYAAYLLGGDIRRAVSMGRMELREIQARPGRYGIDIDMDDSCVPVLYQNHMSERLLWEESNTGHTCVPDTVNQSCLSMPETTADSIPPIIGRDADILLLEAAASESNIINLIGDPGVGKTALQNYVAQWWETSNFVERSFKFDLLKDKDIWSDSTVYERIWNLLGSPPCAPAECENAIHASRYAVFIDNFGIGPEDFNEPSGYPSISQLQRLLDCFQRFSNPPKGDKCVLIILSRGELPLAEELAMKLVKLPPSPIEDATAFAHQIMAQHSLKIDPSETAARHLEHLILLHKNNFLFLEIFIPVLADPSYSLESILWDLQLGLPHNASLRMKAFLDSASDDAVLDKGKPSLSRLLIDFQSLVGFLRSKRPRCYWMLLSLAIFHDSFPRKPLTWLIKLHEKGLVKGVDGEDSILENLPPGRIHVYSNEAIARFFDLNKEWPTDYEDLMQMLLSAGLVHFVDPPSPGCISYADLHPLLPYMIRYEIASQKNGKNLMTELQTMVWEYYERLVHVILNNGKLLAGANYTFSKELLNMMNSIRVCCERPQFGFREMRVLNVLPYLGGPTSRPSVLNLSLKVITFVLERFESLCCRRQFSESPLDIAVRRSILTQSLMVVCSRGLLLAQLKQMEMIAWNTMRAVDLLKYFPQAERVSVNTMAVVFAINCQSVMYKVMPLGPKRQRLKELIGKPLPDGATPSFKFLYHDNWKMILTVSYAFSQTVALGSEEPQEIFTTISQARGSLESVQAYVSSLTREGRGFSEVVQCLLDFISPENAEQNILATLPRLKRSLKTAMRDPELQSEMESLILTNPGAGTEEPEDLAVLENTVARARRIHEPGREVVPLEIFFTQAIKTLDYRAAMLHHNRLRAIAMELPSLALTSVTMQNGEGIRNFRLGRLQLDLAAGRPAEEGRPHLILAEKHLQEAARLLNDDIVSRMELHQTLTALADCTIMLHDDRAERIAFLLKAASLEYVSLYPFSHSSTSGGCVVQNMCHEWLSSAVSKDFELQLTVSLSRHGISSKVVAPENLKKFLTQCARYSSGVPPRWSALVLEEAQFLAVCSIPFKRSLQFWSKADSGNWEVNAAAVKVAIEKNEPGNEHPELIIQSSSQVEIFQEEDMDEAALIEQLKDHRNMWGESHPNTVSAMVNLADKVHQQGNLAEAVRLQTEAMMTRRKMLGDEHADTVATMHDLAVYLSDHGKADESAVMAKEVLAKRKRIFGNEDPSTIISMRNLANILYAQGKLDEAAGVEKEVVEITRKTLGEEHADTIKARDDLRVTLTAMNNLAVKLHGQGDLAQAAAMKKRVLEIRRIILGDEHTDTVVAMNNLAVTLEEQGQQGEQGGQDEAVKLWKTVLETRRRILGEEHTDTLATKSNLGIAFRRQRKFDEAIMVQKEVVETLKTMHGGEYADTATAMQDLAATLHNQGKLDEAAIMKRDVLQMRRRVLGNDHNDTVMMMSSLAATLYNQGQLEEAAGLEKEVVEIRRKNLGAEHPDSIEAVDNLKVTQNAMINRANTLRTEGKLDEATRIHKEVLEAHKDVLGEEHPDTITAMCRVATTLYYQGELDAAAAMESKVLTTRKKVLGEDHADTIRAMSNLAITFRDQGKLDEAATMQIDVVKKRRKLLGEEHPDTVAVTESLTSTMTAINTLANSFREEGKLEEATLSKRKVSEIGKTALGTEHAATIVATYNLACILHNQGELEESALLKREVWDLRRKTLGENHAETIATIISLATTLYNDNKLAEAATLEMAVVEKRRRTLGEEHADTVAAQKNLTVTLAAMNRLSNSYWEEGRLEDAAQLKREILGMQREIFGLDHPGTLTATGNLATVLYDQGKLEEAATLEREVVGKRRKAIGEEHPDTIQAINNLKVTLTAMSNRASSLRTEGEGEGKLEEAVRFQKEVLEAHKDVYGEEHPDTVAAQKNLAVMLTALNKLAARLYTEGKLEDAARIYQKVLETRRTTLGEDHVDTLQAMSSLGVTLWRQGKPEESVALETQVLEQRKKTLGVEHPDTILAQNNLVVIVNSLALKLRSQGKLEEAVALQRGVVETRRKILGEEHADTVAAIDQLAMTLYKQSKLGEAVAILKDVVAKGRKTLGEEHPEVATAMKHLAVISQLTPLHVAAAHGHVEVAKSLLDGGVDCNILSATNETPLHVAARSGQTDMANLLLDHGADSGLVADVGSMPLHEAAGAGHARVVALLLDRGVNRDSLSAHGLTPLHAAALNGFVEVVTLLIHRGAGSDTLSSSGLAPLHVAALKSREEVARRLIESGADCNILSSVLETPLHIAARLGDVGLVKLLLESGADRDKAAPHGLTALHLAAQKGHLEAAMLLLDQGADCNTLAAAGETPLHHAASMGHVKMVTLLLDRGGEQDKATLGRGSTPLHLAAANGHVEVTERLLNHGADPNISSSNGEAPLHAAATAGHVGVVSLLLDHGADRDKPAVRGLTPLHVAVLKGRVEIVKLFLQRGADCNLLSSHGETPLHVAARAGQIEVAQLLFDHGANRDLFDATGNMPLHTAVRAGHVNMVTLFLDRGVDHQHPSLGRSSTPLYIAASNGHLEVVALLLDRGADCNTLTSDGETPLYYAASMGYMKVVALLLNRGADWSTPSADRGLTSLHLAAFKGHVQTVALLLDRGADCNVLTSEGDIPLHYAAGMGHVEVVVLLLNRGADLNRSSVGRSTPLHVAITGAQVAAAALLLDRGADCNALSSHGETPLHIAARIGHVNAAKLLLNHGADRDWFSGTGEMPLHVAAGSGHAGVVTLLLDHGADVSIPSLNGWMALHLAAVNGHVEVVALLLGRGADCNCLSSNAETPLHHAAGMGHVAVVALLLDRGAERDQASVDGGWTPLHIAAVNGYVEAVKLLLDRGADCNVVSSNGETPLYHATGKGHMEVVALLLDRGAERDQASVDGGWTPLHIAAGNGYVEAVKLLLDRGADCNVVSSNGETPLYRAAGKGHMEVVTLLLDRGAKQDKASVDGLTLHITASNGHAAVVTLLIDRGADCNTLSSNGETPLHYAAFMGHVNVAALLLDRGAKYDIASADDGLTPLHLAAANGHVEVVSLLIDRGADCNSFSSSGDAPLHYAAGKGQVEVAIRLLDRGANDQLPCSDGRTALQVAKDKGHAEIVAILLRHVVTCDD
jgi:ankyrin repeat protein/tetratricopeptide (TPR) repeat protein